MKIKQLIKSYSFWTALAGACVILVETLGRAFGFSIENQIVGDVILAIAGVLVAFGIVTIPKDLKKDETDQDDKKEE